MIILARILCWLETITSMPISDETFTIMNLLDYNQPDHNCSSYNSLKVFASFSIIFLISDATTQGRPIEEHHH